MDLNSQWDLGQDAARDIAAALNILLADTFVLLLKTRVCRWHVSGPHFQEHRLMFRELEQQVDATIDDIAERVRRIGATTVISVGHICRLQRLAGDDLTCLSSLEMLAELLDDNLQLGGFLREAHGLCDGYGDVATASRLENWIDDAEGRVRYLFAASRPTQAATNPPP